MKLPSGLVSERRRFPRRAAIRRRIQDGGSATVGKLMLVEWSTKTCKSWKIKAFAFPNHVTKPVVLLAREVGCEILKLKRGP
jgi:hypothetical protein